jgi:hypothetical protein
MKAMAGSVQGRIRPVLVCVPLLAIVASTLPVSLPTPAGAESGSPSIEETVTDSHGNPLAGVCVEAVDGVANTGNVTEGNGTYE